MAWLGSGAAASGQGPSPGAPPRPPPPFRAAPPRRPLPVAPPRAGPDSRRTSSGSAVAAGRRVGAPAGPGLEPSRGRGRSGDPRRRGQWDCDGRGDRDYLPGRRKDISQEGADVCGALHRNAPKWEEI
ncbi:peptidyl-prolyl cis-trans isomerase FKBP1B isoform 1-T1 [Hipposideros larvatus]